MLLDKAHPSFPRGLPVAAQEIKQWRECSSDTQVWAVASYSPVKQWVYCCENRLLQNISFQISIAQFFEAELFTSSKS